MRDRPIAEFMTRSPRCVDATQRVAEAHRLMLETGCRQLPVLKDGKLVGIVSERGLYRLAVKADRANEPVLDAMEAAYAVAPKAPLLEVAAEMAERNAGAAVIARDGEVLGIFTSNDALVVLDRDSARRARADLHPSADFSATPGPARPPRSTPAATAK